MNESKIDLNNEAFQNAWDLLCHTNRSIFLTGKAGTGKSTFLRYICTHIKKKKVILAPTGIAAVNVGGQTLHSFFKLPFKPLLPNDPTLRPDTLKKTLKYSRQKIKLIKELELIVIDEISMVRADIIDFVDKILRYFTENHREPFGGKQLLFVGDIFQLEPVVTPDLRSILCNFYNDFYFFNARVFADLGLIPIELTKLYRQKDEAFVSILDRIRIGSQSVADLDVINSQVNQTFINSEDLAMTLCSRRSTAEEINARHMKQLAGKQFFFEGVIDGIFPENDLPTAMNLELKVGAQVMFIRNDREGRWHNGTLAKVCQLSDTLVEVETEEGKVYSVEPEIWENTQYTYDMKSNKIVEHIMGTFSQYPVKAAWAITVHKSQGLTFNRAIINFSSGAFSAGQVYVALSRCRSLEGISLAYPIREQDILVSRTIIEFSKQFNDQLLVSSALKAQRANDLYQEALKSFQQKNFTKAVTTFFQAHQLVDIYNKPELQRLISMKLQRLSSVVAYKAENQNSLAEELCKQAEELSDTNPSAAEALYVRALELDSNCVQAHVGLANLHYSHGEEQRAIEELELAVVQCKKTIPLLLRLGVIHYERRHYPAATDAFKSVLAMDPNHRSAHAYMINIYEKLKLKRLAKEHMEKLKLLDSIE